MKKHEKVGVYKFHWQRANIVQQNYLILIICKKQPEPEVDHLITMMYKATLQHLSCFCEVKLQLQKHVWALTNLW